MRSRFQSPPIQPAVRSSASIPPAHSVYRPTAGFLGDDSFRVQVSDASGNSVPGVVNINVHPNRAPVATADALRADGAALANITVLDNDTDADSDPLTVTIEEGALAGTATVNANSSIGISCAAVGLQGRHALQISRDRFQLGVGHRHRRGVCRRRTVSRRLRGRSGGERLVRVIYERFRFRSHRADDSDRRHHATAWLRCFPRTARLSPIGGRINRMLRASIWDSCERPRPFREARCHCRQARRCRSMPAAWISSSSARTVSGSR